MHFALFYGRYIIFGYRLITSGAINVLYSSFGCQRIYISCSTYHHSHSDSSLSWHYRIPTFIMGLVAFSIIYFIKKYRPNFPSGLLSIVITSIAVVVFQLHDRGIAIVGIIPKGLPLLNVPFSDFYTISSLIGPSVVIALVSFADAATPNGYAAIAAQRTLQYLI